MRKSLLSVLLASAFATAGAQTVFLNEDFEGGALPSGWTQTTSATDGGWKFGVNTALQSSSWGIPAHTKFTATNDDACNCDKSNDLLKTASIDLSAAAAAHLKVDVYFWNASYQSITEAGTIEASTDGGTTWTVIQTLAGAADWTTLSLDVSAYAGNSNVMFGFRYMDNNGWLFGYAIDNLMVYEPAAIDAAALSISGNSYVTMTSQTIAGEIKNEGATTISSMTLNYSINNGAPVTEALTGLNITPLSTYNYSHATAWTPTATGNHTVKVWASNINGNNDQVNSNDTATKVIYVAQTLAQRKVLIEHFTQASCGPCAAQNPILESLIHSNNNFSKLALIKYHTSWPGTDPMYNFNTADPTARVNYYNVTGVPDAIVDGVAYQGSPANITQQLIDDEYIKPGLFNINFTTTLSGNSLTISGTTTSLVQFNSGTMKVHVALIEDPITYSSAPGTNGETVFPQVLRKLFPNASGTTIGTPTDGQVNTFNFTYTVPSSLVTNNLFVVVFVQDNATKEVHQAYVSAVTTGINDEASAVSSLGIYPNPLTDNATVAFELKSQEHVSVNIYNMLGELVYTVDKGELQQGEHTLNIDASGLTSGMYYLDLVTGNSRTTRKISIAK